MAGAAALTGTGLLEALRAGQALGFGEAPPARGEIERALDPATEAVRGSLERHGGLEPGQLDAALESVRHEFIDYRGARVHLEVHAAGEDRPTIAVHHGLGDHVRRMTPLAARFVAEGFNVVMMDRPGHGVSEGRRGHCPLGWALELVDQGVHWVRERFRGPVILLGDSLGGITLWYALTRDVDAEAVVCHCISHPEVRHDRSMVVKAPLMRAGARVRPYAPVPVTQIADYSNVALDPVTKDYFDRRADPAFCFEASLATTVSYLDFTPGRPWESVRTPVLVTIGGADRMITPEFTRESFDRATPPRAEYLEMPGLGHQMFLDHLEAAFPPLIEWVKRTVG